MGFTITLAGQENWTALFNGKNLKGWKQLNGTAKYEVKDGTITGSTVLASPNSFLCTVAFYSDFILEYDVLVDPQLNSGVQIRSHSYKEYQNGRVHGYQIEIDPSDRGWSAGVYDEARRAWLYPLGNNSAALKAFKKNSWNQFHVEAIGHTIRTWINGVPASNLIDDMDSTGFIGLQVHGIGTDPKKAGIQVQWKNIRLMTKDLARYTWKMPATIPEISAISNTLTNQELKDGWKLLWDGKTTGGWRGADKADFPSKGWEIKDNLLTVIEGSGAESRNGGDIVTVKKYGDFELTLDYKLTKGANSGIKYYVVEGLNSGSGSAIGLEFQLFDDENQMDAKLAVGETHTIGSLYDLIPALADKVVNPVGEWNNARIIAKNNHIEHWLNGKKIVEYDRGTQIYRALVQKSKYASYPNFGEAPEGHILLQDHGGRVSFKNIKIKE
ncbi:MAG: DUF1080 domain-containing protein [Bacteroidia bacterium]|nr:DUF1080 domain-containing protein [Bacteroidia bacterium]